MHTSRTAPRGAPQSRYALAHAPSAARAPSAGALVLDRYRIEHRLGAGGFGEVWQARDERLGRPVALKVIPGAGAPGDRAKRAAREAAAAARLNHPAVVVLYEAWFEGADAYLVSELVAGRTLAALEREGALSDRDVARIGIALCEALEHAHAHGVVHRDVKPQNVLIPDATDGPAPAKLTDFGVAQLVGDDPLTLTGDVLGTLAYMAPEQAEGREVDARADLYSLSLVLYEALAGEHPVRASSPAASLRRLGAPIPSLRRQRRGLPIPLSAAIDRALAPEPDRRGSIADLHEALIETIAELADEGGIVAPSPVERALTRRQAGFGARVIAATAGAALAAALFVFADPRPPLAATTALIAVALALALAPRVAWLAAAAGAVGWLAFADPGHGGQATVLAAGLLMAPLLLARTGVAWSLALAGPLAGALGVAAGAAAAAATLRGWWQRAAVAALSWWWLALAELLSGRTLAFGPPAAARPEARWGASATDAIAHALWPLLASGRLAVGLVWAAGAAIMPLLICRRSIAGVIAGALVWAVAMVASTSALDRALGLSAPRGLVLGAAAGALAAAALILLAPTRSPRRADAAEQPRRPESEPVA
ncbi:MAG: protein kinase domain-containing protein [Solirubrobacteraceae bacterium]